MGLPAAPLRVPVELRLAGSRARWFRLASAVSPEGLLFLRDLPEAIAEGARDGRPVAVTFHLPEDEAPITLDARPVEAPPDRRDDRPRTAAVRFLRPDEAAVLRITRWAQARLLGDA